MRQKNPQGMRRFFFSLLTSAYTRAFFSKSAQEDVRWLVEISDEPDCGLHLIVLKVLKQ